ncbi:MAG: hypothetical protein LBI27_04660 [Clostridiales bacterium]|jgi:hypothetical protein|nr:hypothetical protein [Clostridiales bacterium]
MKKMISTICVLTQIFLLSACFFDRAERSSEPPERIEQNRSTNTLSSEFETAAERIAFLSEYLVMPTEIIDADFHVIYHDNSGFLPGPSDWYVHVAVLVEPDLIDEWILGFEETEENPIENMPRWSGVPTENVNWQGIDETSEFYKRPNSRTSWRIVYRDAGIILIYVSSSPVMPPNSW